jgi:hypothetical protein
VVYSSPRGVGAVLQQQPEGSTDKRPVAFFSAKLSSCQQRYVAVQIECYAVLLAVEHFRMYLEGRRFHLYTQSNSLNWLFGEAILKPVLARWVLRLQVFDFVIHCLKGASNPAEVHARALLPAAEAVSQPGEVAMIKINQVVKRTPCATADLDMDKLKDQ